jgi:hypothetical protein
LLEQTRKRNLLLCGIDHPETQNPAEGPSLSRPEFAPKSRRAAV